MINIKSAMPINIVYSSFRDPSGFVFYRDNTLYRQINNFYKEEYDHLMKSGLYKRLVDSNLMISHEETDVECANPTDAYKIIKPEFIPFISYPYEWSFSQLKDAALTTLEIQKIALSFGMTLKDASAYNIQFHKGRPLLIDTLSFEIYSEGKPWVAPYRQFCRHFLAPLSLMKYVDVRLNRLSQICIDGIPLDLASSLLPLHTYFNSTLFYHIHINAKLPRLLADKPLNKEKQKMPRKELIALIDKLELTIKEMKWKLPDTEWGDYYEKTNYPLESFNNKKEIVLEFLKKLGPKTVLDIGANTGEFTRIASSLGVHTISIDSDFAAVEKNYIQCVKNKETNILPLIVDLTNPSPDIGWENKERTSFIERFYSDTAMALALIHHLAISNNLTFEKIVNFFSRICNSLIIEFVPKIDSKVQLILSRREDIFTDYNEKEFEKNFKKYFDIIESKKIKNSERILYLMKKK